MKREAIVKTIAHLKTVDAAHFDQSYWKRPLADGTHTGCLAWHVLLANAPLDAQASDWWTIPGLARHALGLGPQEDARVLFLTGLPFERTDRVTAQDAVAMLERLLETGRAEWSPKVMGAYKYEPKQYTLE